MQFTLAGFLRRRLGHAFLQAEHPFLGGVFGGWGGGGGGWGGFWVFFFFFWGGSREFSLRKEGCSLLFPSPPVLTFGFPPATVAKRLYSPLFSRHGSARYFSLLQLVGLSLVLRRPRD